MLVNIIQWCPVKSVLLLFFMQSLQCFTKDTQTEEWLINQTKTRRKKTKQKNQQNDSNKNSGLTWTLQTAGIHLSWSRSTWTCSDTSSRQACHHVGCRAPAWLVPAALLWRSAHGVGAHQMLCIKDIHTGYMQTQTLTQYSPKYSRTPDKMIPLLSPFSLKPFLPLFMSMNPLPRTTPL